MPIGLPRRTRIRRRFTGTVLLALVVIAITAWAAWPRLNWPDRRPIGALFLASYAHRSATNPRGWFNAPALDVTGPGGEERFRRALSAYAERALMVLRTVHAQGMIVWDVEGEEFPQKTSYIGDPRLLDTLAPEMARAVDEFFRKFRDAGLRVGMTIRPQELIVDAPGQARQRGTWRPGEVLLQKVDYARRRWGASLFYIDSNRGFLWPGEILGLSQLARERPDVLLIPEHHLPLYYGFSAPYGELRDGDTATSGLTRWLAPHAFQVLNVSDASMRSDELTDAYRNGDVLLFPAWFWGKESEAVKAITAR